ncbi:MAG: type II toxin-antitoxin system VapC family toxin [Syntrophothermus sp.]
MSEAVVDASALLAYLFDEPGADAVAMALSAGACMSAVNFSEVLAKLSDHGISVDQALSDFKEQKLLNILEIVDFNLANAEEAARLRHTTRDIGLSLGDRACLALGRIRNSQVLTADSFWAKVQGIDVIMIR